MRTAVAGSLALAAIVLLGQSAQAQLLEKKALSLEAARKMVAAAEAEAERNHWRGVVAVVHDGARLYRDARRASGHGRWRGVVPAMRGIECASRRAKRGRLPAVI